MKSSILELIFSIAVLGALSPLAGVAAQATGKTIRVEHGRPVVIVSQKSVLLLEFIKEPRGDAMIPHPEKDIRHCRARYHYQVYDAESGDLTNGEGMVEE